MTTIIILMIFPRGAVIVTLWGFLTTSPVGVAIFLTEVVVGVVSRVIEITIIRRIIPSVRVVYDENPRSYDYPSGDFRCDTGMCLCDYPCWGYRLVDDCRHRDARHSDVNCRRYDDYRFFDDRRIDVYYRHGIGCR